MELKVETWPIEKLVPYARNPRKNDAQIERMASAIQEFGFRIPVVAKSDGSVVDGHLRLKAAQKLGLTEIPVALADELSEAQVKAFRLLANKSANWAEWDDELLKLELDELRDMDFDLELTGFDADELQAFEPVVVPQADEDDVPEVQENEPPVTREGDVWLCGNHRVMCGDSTDAGSVALLMNGEKADICFTSPPYNAGHTPSEGNDSKKTKYLDNEDNKTQHDYAFFLSEFTKCALDNASFVFVNIQSLTGNKIALIDYLHEFKQFYADTIIWDKIYSQPAMAKNVLNSEFEFVHIFSEKANRAIGVKPFRGTISNILHISSQRKNDFSDIHNATFPLEFAQFFVSNFAKKSVFEPFGGTGTTLIACENSGCSCFTMELSPHYCDVIVKRWQDYTGQKATLEADGRTFDEVANG